MVQLVKAMALPAEQKVTIRGSCAAVVPRDALDRDALNGVQIDDKDKRAELQRRRALVQRKCLSFAATIDEKLAQELLKDGVGEVVASWLEKTPAPKAVDELLLRVGLLVQSGPPVEIPTGVEGKTRTLDPVMRPDLGTPGRRACYSALLSFKDVAPSSCASRLFDLAMALARKLEAQGNQESGSAHALVCGLIVQG